jgi:hypothetical protein
MDWKIPFIKAAKAAAYALLGAVLVALTGADFSAAIDAIAAAVASYIPIVGGLAKGVVLSFLTAGVAALVVALENIRKHLLD